MSERCPVCGKNAHECKWYTILATGAHAAIERIEARKGEDVAEWAQTLAESMEGLDEGTRMVRDHPQDDTMCKCGHPYKHHWESCRLADWGTGCATATYLCRCNKFEEAPKT